MFNKFYSRSFLALVAIVFVLLSAGCVSSGPETPASTQLPPPPPRPTATPDIDVSKITFQGDVSITEEIVRDCTKRKQAECYYTDYSDFALFVVHSSGPYVGYKEHYTSKASLDWSSAFVTIPMKKGDLMYFGTTDDIKAWIKWNNAKPDIVYTVEITKDANSAVQYRTITVKGGPFYDCNTRYFIDYSGTMEWVVDLKYIDHSAVEFNNKVIELASADKASTYFNDQDKDK